MAVLDDVVGSPFYVETGSGAVAMKERLAALSDRVNLLRNNQVLSEATLHLYYGQKRFEQIAESNALEGSTLSVGETELAVLKGITITGHDPAYSRDAQSLAKALDRLAELAREGKPSNISQAKELHELVMGGQQGAGMIRTVPVHIRGSNHRPPTTWHEVMVGMEQWQAWSEANTLASPMLRATVLHAWLTQIHPFVDGNGRTARAILNLELIRSGYPPIIIRKKDRDRYLDCLAAADDGQLGPLLDLLSQRADDALRELERSASRTTGYDPLAVKKRQNFESRLAIWNAGIHLLVELLKSRLQSQLALSGYEIVMKEFDELTVEDFIELSEGRSIPQSWAFRVECRNSAGRSLKWLCWAGFLDAAFRSALRRSGIDTDRPALLWSVKTDSYPPWRQALPNEGPCMEQMTIVQDKWVIWRGGEKVDMSSVELADLLSDRVVDGLVPSSKL